MTSGSGGASVLSVRDLRVALRDGTVILDGLSLDLDRGEALCVLGPSGSGKSTLAFALMGLLRPALQVVSGRGVVCGQQVDFTDPEDVAGLRGSSISMIFQEPLSSLNPVLSCGRQAEEPLRIHTNADASERRKRVLALFREMGFEDPERIYDSLPAELSGGQIQRALLAMAVAAGPVVLLADEPTTALDRASRDAVLRLLARLREHHGLSVILITHDRDLAHSFPDRVVQVEDGRFVPGPRQTDPSAGAKLSHPAAALRAEQKAPLLSAQNLTKTFTRRGARGGAACLKALDDVSIEVGRGEVLGIVGPSGSGKTTLGRCIAGLTRPDAGEIRVGSQRVNGRPSRGQSSPVQLIHQSPFASLNPMMPAGEAIAEGPRAHGVPPTERAKLAAGLLESVGLEPSHYSRFPDELSGGERQRVVIARALAVKPEVLVADEPTASLDERTGSGVLDLLKALARQRGLGVLLISHDQTAIGRIADRVARFEDGRIVADGTAESSAHRLEPTE